MDASAKEWIESETLDNGICYRLTEHFEKMRKDRDVLHRENAALWAELKECKRHDLLQDQKELLRKTITEHSLSDSLAAMEKRALRAERKSEEMEEALANATMCRLCSALKVIEQRALRAERTLTEREQECLALKVERDALIKEHNAMMAIHKRLDEPLLKQRGVLSAHITELLGMLAARDREVDRLKEVTEECEMSWIL